MSEIVTVPKLGLTMTEATIGEWLALPGDRVSEGESLVEIETDKITHMVTAPRAGTVLALFAGTGDVLPVSSPLCELE